ncbi:MAG: Cas10/Cmr2 second palm domain-containing protein [Capsulimonadaceae bacterium]
MRTLGFVDIAGIQEYILRSPELKDIRKASNTIENLGRKPKGSDPPGLFHRCAARHGATVIVAAGGNCSFMAESGDSAKAVIRSISRGLLEISRDLNSTALIRPIDSGSFAAAYRDALVDLDAAKLTQPRNCGFTMSGLADPAPVGVVDPMPPNRKDDCPEGYVEPSEFNHVICRSSEKSDLMAVVSIDGLRMGGRLIDWLDGAPSDETQFCAELKGISKSVTDRWRDAWHACLDKLAEAFTAGLSPNGEHVDRNEDRALSLQYDRETGLSYLPCRKVYQGGDDLVFVADARIALSMAAMLARRLEARWDGVPEEFRTIPVSIGILMTNSHFPFSRALKLAGIVQDAAKERAYKVSLLNPASAINWWVNRQGAMERPEPPFKGASMRPYLLNGDAHPQTSAGISWSWMEDIMLPEMHFWFDSSRNKLKNLLEAAEEGSGGAAVR